jgi:putative copper resistance protein D
VADPLLYLRAVHFAATILAAGVVIFECVVAEPAFAAANGALYPALERLQRRWARVVWASLGVAILSGALWFVLLAAGIYDAHFDYLWHSGALWTVATETRFGQVAALRFAAAVLLAALLMRRRGGTAVGGGRRIAQLIFATAFLISPAWIGHAGGTPGGSGLMSLSADASHLLAAGAWLGGLPPLAMLLLAAAWRQKEPSWATLTAAAVRRFSRLGVASVGALLASGIINSWYEVGTLANLLTTAYGRLVLVKIALFTAMVALAAVNRLYFTPRLATVGAVRRLHQTTLVETALGLAAVAVVGFLGAMPPASHAHHQVAYAAIPADAAFVHIHSMGGMADVTIVPGRVGAARAIIRLWDENFEPLTVQEVTLLLNVQGVSRERIIRNAWQDQDGEWEVDDIELSRPGNWMVDIHAAVDAKRRLVLEAPIVIEPKH